MAAAMVPAKAQLVRNGECYWTRLDDHGHYSPATGVFACIAWKDHQRVPMTFGFTPGPAEGFVIEVRTYQGEPLA